MTADEARRRAAFDALEPSDKEQAIRGMRTSGYSVDAIAWATGLAREMVLKIVGEKERGACSTR